MNVIDILKELRDNWTRNQFTTGTMARNGHQTSVLPRSPEAEQWCTVGRINKVLGDLKLVGTPFSGDPFDGDLLRTAHELGYPQTLLTHLNDQAGYDGMQKIIGATIERLEEEQSATRVEERELALV